MVVDAVLTASSVGFVNNHFSVCCKPVGDFLKAEMVVFDRSVKPSRVFGNGRGLVPSYHAGVNLRYA